MDAELVKTRDLAEHWMIIAEQRRVELGECRKDAAALWMMLDDIDTGGDIAKADDVLYRAIAERSHKRRFEPSYEWVTAYIAAMEAKP